MSADRNVREALFGKAEKRADAIGGGGDLLDDLVHLFDGGTCFGKCEVVLFDLLPEAEEIEARGIAFPGGGNEFVDQRQGRRVILVAPFLPSPLIEKLGSEGFASKVERGAGADWLIYFWREAD